MMNLLLLFLLQKLPPPKTLGLTNVNMLLYLDCLILQ
jgi:hypothetical protein